MIFLIAVFTASFSLPQAEADVYENFTCDVFEGREWLSTTYEMNMDDFSRFWLRKEHWFVQMRSDILEAGTSFPILEATGWNETQWEKNRSTGRFKRTLLYDIDPKSAFVKTSHVNETQIVIAKEKSSLTFLRTLSNSGFPFSDTFHVEFLLCANEKELQVSVKIKGRIVPDSSFYWVVEGTVEDGVNEGAIEYYGIFDFAIKKWIDKSKKSGKSSDFFDISNSNAIMGDEEVVKQNKDTYDYYYYGSIAAVAILLLILTFLVRRQKG